jgi:hypothetical protein
VAPQFVARVVVPAQPEVGEALARRADEVEDFNAAVERWSEEHQTSPLDWVKSLQAPADDKGSSGTMSNGMSDADGDGPSGSGGGGFEPIFSIPAARFSEEIREVAGFVNSC